MSWSRGGSGRRGYHHGNLREALVRAALALIAEKGPAGFTFAEAARSAGVSPAAPYRHFRDRDELMADVARRGYERFEIELAAAWNGGQPETLTAFENLGRAYLAFARNEPAYYSAMFETGLPLDTDPALDAGKRACLRGLKSAAEAIAAKSPKGKPAAFADDGASCLGSFARRGLPLRARGCGTTKIADDRRNNCSRQACSSTCRAWGWVKQATLLRTADPGRRFRSSPHERRKRLGAPFPVLRLFVDGPSGSRIDNYEIERDLKNFAPPAAPLYVSETKAASGFVMIRLPVGWDGRRHPSPRQQILFCLAGRARVTPDAGDPRIIGAGEALLMADTYGGGHKTEVISDVPFDAVIVQLPDNHA